MEILFVPVQKSRLRIYYISNLKYACNQIDGDVLRSNSHKTNIATYGILS
jgi:hypothetical protein